MVLLNAIHGLVSSPLPVVVKSMTPEVVKSLPPVAVRSMPGPDLLTGLGIVAAALAALFSGIAVMIAVLTLGKVNKQLIVANSQLERADTQLELAKEELDAVKRDLILSQDQFDLNDRQFRELMRRPNLSLMARQTGETLLATFPNGTRPKVVTLAFVVRNSGTAVARDVLLQVFVSGDQLEDQSAVNLTAAGVNTTLMKPSLLRIFDDGAHCGFSFYGSDNLRYAIRPEGDFVVFEGGFLLKPVCTNVKVLWRCFDQYGVYPQEDAGLEGYGTCDVTLAPTS